MFFEKETLELLKLPLACEPFKSVDMNRINLSICIKISYYEYKAKNELHYCFA